jgi:PhoH-like ATPase
MGKDIGFLPGDVEEKLKPWMQPKVKTILTRAGENSKVVLTGDPYQIDNPFVDSASNGLSCIVEKFKGESIAGHVLLMKGERSPLAELAANIL